MTEKEQAVLALLKKKEIPFELQEHPAVYTVEEGKKIGVHPNENTATVWLNTDDLVYLLKEHGNFVKYVAF